MLLPDGFSSLGTSFCMSAWPNSQPGGRLPGQRGRVEEKGERKGERERVKCISATGRGERLNTMLSVCVWQKGGLYIDEVMRGEC